MKKDYRLKGYVTLFPFMPEELNLKGVPYIVFAVIFGFSTSEKGCFDGSLDYLMKWTNASKATISRSLKYLCDRKLIVKKEVKANGSIKYYTYRINYDNETIAKVSGKIIF